MPSTAPSVRRAISTSCRYVRCARSSVAPNRAAACRRRRRQPGGRRAVQQQRQIIAATFNINRDRKTMSADKLREASTVVALSQARLREQVEGLLTRMNSRLVEQDPAFKKVADLLPAAVAEMKNAEAKLQKTESARRDRRRSRRRFRRCRRPRKSTKCRSARSSGGGGGGGGNNSMAEDLADLFELEAGSDGEPVPRRRSAPSSSRPISRSTSWRRS